MDIEKELGKKIIEIYKRTIFGKLSKVEIDLIVFGMLVKEIFKNDKNINGGNNFNWFRINGNHMRQLSFKFQITESRVANLLEQSALLDLKYEENDKILLEEILYLIGKFHQDKKDINEGNLKLYIPNNITKTSIEAFIEKHNGVPRYNQKILTVRFIDLLRCFKYKKPIYLLLDIAKKSNQSSKSEEITAILNEVNSKTAAEKIKLMASSTLKIFLGASGEFMSDEFFNVLKNTMNME